MTAAFCYPSGANECMNFLECWSTFDTPGHYNCSLAQSLCDKAIVVLSGVAVTSNGASLCIALGLLAQSRTQLQRAHQLFRAYLSIKIKACSIARGGGLGHRISDATPAFT